MRDSLRGAREALDAENASLRGALEALVQPIVLPAPVPTHDSVDRGAREQRKVAE